MFKIKEISLPNIMVRGNVLGKGIKRTGDPSLARMAALSLVARFREAPDFRMMLLAPRGLTGLKHPFGPSDSLAVDELDTLSPIIDLKAFDQILYDNGFPRGLADFLKPCGDPIADLSDLRLYRYREPVMVLLRKQGYLLLPGALAQKG